MQDGTMFTGKYRIELDKTGSTNAHCAQLLKTKRLPEGTVVVARSQTAGRGQAGSVWHSAPGQNLTVSTVFYPSFLAPADQFLLTVVVSLGVKQCVEAMAGRNAGVWIKWPNDVYAGDRKIAGILIGNAIRGGRITSTIAGVGLNVNQEVFPPGLTGVTSLRMETGRLFDLRECLDALCRFTEAHYLALRGGAREKLRAAYTASLYRMGQWHGFVLGGRNVRARINGVDAQGRLLLETEDGAVHTPGMKEVQYL